MLSLIEEEEDDATADNNDAAVDAAVDALLVNAVVWSRTEPVRTMTLWIDAAVLRGETMTLLAADDWLVVRTSKTSASCGSLSDKFCGVSCVGSGRDGGGGGGGGRSNDEDAVSEMGACICPVCICDVRVDRPSLVGITSKGLTVPGG